ncbi:14-3-3 family protein [Pseudonocardia sp. GCM10023141]
MYELQAAAASALAAGRVDAAKATFAEATRLACEVLPPADPVRLAVAGAHADAWFEHWNDAERAWEIGQAAYDAAVFAIDDAPQEQYGEAVRLLSDLRDQMTFWAFRMSS